MGKFKDGNMITGQKAMIVGQEEVMGMRVPLMGKPSGPFVKHCPVSFNEYVDPLETDPVEDRYVYVKDSPIEGQGLFAKEDIKMSTVVAYFGGFHFSVESWNKTKIFDPIYFGKAKDHKIVHYFYLPDEYGKDLNKYRASLGHKINHDFYNYNCLFTLSSHPRFGLVAAARLVEDVKKDDEIVCHYNLEYDEAQPYYQAL